MVDTSNADLEKFWFFSSAVEQGPYKAQVVGSIPTGTTNYASGAGHDPNALNVGDPCGLHQILGCLQQPYQLPVKQTTIAHPVNYGQMAEWSNACACKAQTPSVRIRLWLPIWGCRVLVNLLGCLPSQASSILVIPANYVRVVYMVRIPGSHPGEPSSILGVDAKLCCSETFGILSRKASA